MPSVVVVGQNGVVTEVVVVVVVVRVQQNPTASGVS